MSIRSQWCEFDKETRKYIKKRDKERCVICGTSGALQVMHIFLSRSKGGKGCKENGCLGCVKCHQIIDNPIGKSQNELSKKYLQYCKEYLKKEENILKNYSSIEEMIETLLKYTYKFIVLKSFNENSINVLEKQKRCKKCVYLVKNKYSNNSINSYYCKRKRKIISKNNKICSEFKEII